MPSSGLSCPRMSSAAYKIVPSPPTATIRSASAARDGGLTRESGDLAPAEGHMEFSYRISPIFRFGGGTNEIMRDIVAMAGLGLPR